jgi:hypothetical protein
MTAPTLLNAHEQALTYVARGWQVFPVPIGTKKSHKAAKHSGGRQWGATTDVDEVRQDFNHWPEANVGIVTGPKSGIFVVECDTLEGHDVDGIASLEKVVNEHGALPKTLIAESPSGSLHHYFKYPDSVKIKNSASKIAQGIDVRGDGGMVVAPPSVKPGVGSYVWLNDYDIADAPDWLLTMCKEEPAKSSPAPVQYQAVDHAEVATALAVIPSDDESVWFKVGCAIAKEFGDTGLPIFIKWSAKSQKYVANECEEKWEHCKTNTGYNIATIFHYANEALPGWRDALNDEPTWLEEMNERYMVVNEAGKTVVYRPAIDPVLERDYLETNAFDDLRKAYLNDRVEVGTDTNGKSTYKTKADAWLEHPQRKQYLGGVVFAPGQLLPADTYNLWQGFAVEPVQGDWSYLRDHILYVICNGDKNLGAYLIGWMAKAVQEPGKQGEVAVVMRGGRGTGKGTFANWFGKLFGQHFMYLTNAKHLVGNFNAHLRDAVVVFADEAFFAGDKSHASVLKGMITDPFITIEAKYKNAVTARNIIHLLMASNEDWVVPAGQDERRFCVVELCSAVKQNHKYFEEINKQMENGGLAAMLYDLQNHDLTGFNVRAVPTTNALVDQKIKSLTGTEAWLYDVLQRGEIRHQPWTSSGLVIPKNSAYEDYKDRHKDFRDYAPAGISSWAKSVRSIMRGAVSETRPEVDGTRVRSLVFPPLDQCRDVFLGHLGQVDGQDHVWETDDE